MNIDVTVMVGIAYKTREQRRNGVSLVQAGNHGTRK